MTQWGRQGIVRTVVFACLVGCVWVMPVAADQMSSSNFKLNGNVNSSFGGQGGSTNYGMFSTGGEALIGNGAGGSYILGQGFTAQTQQSMQITAQPSGLLAHLNFDETAGKLFTDSSATRADGIMRLTNDGDLTHTAGKIGGALTSTGAADDSGILIPAGSIQPASVTMSVWVNPTAMNAYDNICSYHASGSYDYGPFELFTGPSDKFHWTTRTSFENQIATPPDFPPGSWYHVVGTFDAATGVSNLYVNGALAGAQTFTPESINYSVANTENNISCFNNPRWPGEGLRGSLDHLKIFNRALRADEVKAEYDAQNAGVPTGLSLSEITPGISNTAAYDVIVRTDSGGYGIAVSQNHDLQSGLATIPAISGSIASPAAWSEGTTKGLGFTLISAPSLDGKWGAGANYAAFPGTATTYYTRTDHASSDTIDVIASRLRVDAAPAQQQGLYENTVTYTGTAIP